jgi:hypothetical protein
MFLLNEHVITPDGRRPMARDVDGAWQLAQSNGFTVEVDIVQPRDGSGNLGDGDVHGGAKIVEGGSGEANLEGNLAGDALEFRVHWPNGAVGQYSGRYDASGSLSGVTFDIANPGSQATWFRTTFGHGGNIDDG